MDIRKVKKLIELLEESQLSEIEISEGEESIRLSRNFSNAAAPVAALVPAVAAPAAAPPQQMAAPADGGTDDQVGHKISSPIVGTFYASAGPDAGPFVTIGSRVEPGETLCIIEAMKIFNQIEAEISGVVKKILKTNGDPVEFGETLFVIE